MILAHLGSHFPPGPTASGGPAALGATRFPTGLGQPLPERTADLADLQAVNSLAAELPARAESDDVTRAQVTADLLKQLLKNDPSAAVKAVNPSGIDSLHRRRLIADLLR